MPNKFQIQLHICYAMFVNKILTGTSKQNLLLDGGWVGLNFT